MTNEIDILEKPAIRLTSPRSGKQVDQAKLKFAWLPVRIRGRRRSPLYRLSLYALKPHQSFAAAAKTKPIYTVTVKTTSYPLPATSKAVKLGKAYCWRVEACDEEGIVLASSAVQGFRARPRVPRPLDMVMAGASARRDPAEMLPPAPFVFGHPTIWRPLADLPAAAPEEPGEERGETGHEKWTLWGEEAARLYLIEAYWQNAPIEWDYSLVPGCERVLLQIAGPDGFQDPNSLNAPADPGVAIWYTGGVIVGRLSTLQVEDSSFEAPSILNLQHTRTEHEPWSDLSIRLAPLDGAGVQIGPASDHVTVFCVDTPRVALEDVGAWWDWGATCTRSASFTVRLRRDFPSTEDGEDAPFTMVIAGTTPSNIADIANATLTNLRLQWRSGEEVGEPGTWEGKPAYFISRSAWHDGAIYQLQLDQLRSLPDARPGTSMTACSLVHFTDLQLRVHCVPGLQPSSYYGDARLTDDNVPSGGPGASHTDTSGIEPLFELWTGSLSGTRISRHIVDGVEEVVEREVEVSFRFSDAPSSADEFHDLILSTHFPGGITMVETCDGSVTEYDVRMEGWDLGLTQVRPAGEFSEYLFGRAVYWLNGDTRYDRVMTLNWQTDHSNWDNREIRMVEDIETVDYYIGRPRP